MTMPDLASALQGAGPPPGPVDSDDQPGQPSDDTGTGGFTNSLDALDAAEDALHAFIQLDPDPGDRAIAAKCLQEILKLQASNQEAMGGGGGDLKGLRRALQGAGGGGGQ